MTVIITIRTGNKVVIQKLRGVVISRVGMGSSRKRLKEFIRIINEMNDFYLLGFVKDYYKWKSIKIQGQKSKIQVNRINKK